MQLHLLTKDVRRASKISLPAVVQERPSLSDAGWADLLKFLVYKDVFEK